MRLGIVVGSRDPWRFFNPILEDLRTHYEVRTFAFQRLKTPILNERINRIRFRHAISRFLSEHDVVFFEWASDLLAAATCLPKRSRIVTRLHRYELFEWAPRVVWDAVDAVILVSESMRRRFVERFPSQAAKTVVLPVGVSTERYRPATKPFAGDVGTLCSLTPRKRVYELILAFRELARSDAQAHLHIGGGCEPQHLDYFEAMQSLVKRAGLQDRVTCQPSI